MKSYLLEPIQSQDNAIAALTSALPGQTEPWLLKDSSGDAIAYFSLEPSEHQKGMFSICADLSGRHFNKDSEVISVLKNIGKTTGGKIIDDWDNLIE